MGVLMTLDKVLDSSSKSITAVVKLDKGEVADIEKIVLFVDHCTGNFGFSARIIQIGDEKPPEYTHRNVYDKKSGLQVKTQFGFEITDCLSKVRYYEIRVERD